MDIMIAPPVESETARSAAKPLDASEAAPKVEETRKIAFICSKGTLDMAYPALVMGWAALGNGIDVTIFFTFWGMDIINKARIDHLELAPVANTSMKMSMMGVNSGNLGIPNALGVFPGMTAFATNLMKKKIAEVGAPPVREYLQMLVDGGAKLYACKMSVDMMGLSMDDFVEGVQGIVTAADFMDMTEGAQIIFI
jgi:peroxiredoxin family protein